MTNSNDALGVHSAALVCLDAIANLSGRSIRPNDAEADVFAELRVAVAKVPATEKDPFCGTTVILLNGESATSYHAYVIDKAQEWLERLPRGLGPVGKRTQTVVCPNLGFTARELRPHLEVEMQRWRTTKSERSGRAEPTRDEASSPSECGGEFDRLLGAIDQLTTFVTNHGGDRPRDDYLELVKLDHEVAACCQVTGISRPTISYEGTYGDSFVGFCRVPVSRSTSSCHIWGDRGWYLAMQGLRRVAELARDQRRSQGRASVSMVPVKPPRNPACTDRYQAETVDGRPTPPNVGDLWDRDPVRAFEHLRDRVCAAIHLVVELHRLAQAAPAGRTLADVDPERHETLRQTIIAAQAIWFDSPIAGYLDRVEGPVNLDNQQDRAIGRVSGSCYHDLALSVAVGLLHWIEEAAPASVYTASMRYYTAAGDHVSERLTGLIAQVRCECQKGISRWKVEHGSGSRAEPSVAAPVSSTRIGSDSIGTVGQDHQETGEADELALGAGAGDNSTPVGRADQIRQLEPAVRRAWLAFCFAESKRGNRLQDQEAYDLLKDEGISPGTGHAGELEDYELPEFETWARYLREARKVLGESKYTRRAGRPFGKSIVKADHIERPERDEE